MRRAASFTSLMLLICWAVFLIDQVLPKQNGYGTLLLAGALIPTFVEQGQWYRLITSGFLHFNWPHIIFNSIALFQAGALVEYIYGTARYATIYLAALLGGSVLAYITTAGSQTVTAGASGAIMGVFGAMAVLGLKLPPLRKELLQNAILPIVLTLGYGFSNPGISNAGHIGGVITGVIVASLLHPARADEILTAMGLADRGELSE